MKTIEKITRDGDIQIFEIMTSKKELREFINMTFGLSKTNQFKLEVWEDEDSSITFYDINGKCHCFSEGDKITRFNISNIVKMANDNSATIVLYGDIPIVYNEHYGDWEVEL